MVTIDDSLVAYQNDQLQRVPKTFHRYMYDRFPWEGRMVGLVGPRGVGKSTLLLQHMAESSDREQSMYVSADSLYLATHMLVDLTDSFVKYGGKHLYIDEVHKYKNWSRELKQIYDTHPALKVFITGSSILDLLDGEADLSRRIIMRHLHGMSFREYLKLVHKIDVPVYSLEEILAGKAQPKALPHPLPLFRQYLRDGYYPFSLEGDIRSR